MMKAHPDTKKVVGAWLGAVAASVATLVAVPAWADETATPPPQDVGSPDVVRPANETREPRLAGEAASTVQASPMIMSLGVGARYRAIVGEDEGGRPPYVELGAGIGATTAYVAPQIHAQARLLPSLTLRAEYTLVRYTARNHGLVELDSKAGGFADALLDAAGARAGTQHRIALVPGFENRLGPILLRGHNRISYIHTEQGAAYSYLPDLDTLVKDRDVVLDSRTDILVTPWKSGPDAALRIGPTLQSTYAIRTNTMRQRLGGTIAFMPATELGPFRRAGVVIDAGVNLDDTNRSGKGFATLALSTEF